MKLTAVAAPGVLAGSVTGREVFEAALAAHGLDGELVLTRSPDEFATALRDAAVGGEFLLVAGDDSPADEWLAGVDARVVRVDLDAREPDLSRCVRRHVRWRGMQGLAFAVDDWFVHRSNPGSRHGYGADPDQYGELRLPEGTGPFPVAVLVHGGYWRSRWDADLMHPIAIDLTSRGFATWNVEYRRPDRHGWDATTADLSTALDALRTLDAPLDLDRVVTLGHSAGGQLVTRLAADRADGGGIRPALTVSLAGCLDLASIHDRGLSEHAVARALGGAPEQLPDVYAASSPIERVPLGLPVVVVCGLADDPDLLDASRRFAATALGAGDDVAVVEAPGHHFSVIDPASDIWSEVADLVVSRAQG